MSPWRSPFHGAAVPPRPTSAPLANEKILGAAWCPFDEAVKSARGKMLATGPRGGERSLAVIATHVIGADGGHLGAVGGKAPKATKPGEQLAATRESIPRGAQGLQTS